MIAKPLCYVLAAVVLAGGTACSTTPPLQQVVLSPPPSAQAVEGASRWEVRRVRVPEYLDNYDVQLRTDDYVLTRLPNAKWAERLPVAMTRLIQQTIDEKLLTARDRRYEVAVTVDTFEPQPSGQVVLAASWKVTDSRDERVVARHQAVIRETLPAGAARPAAIGRAMSSAVRQLAMQIVAQASY